MGDSCDPSSRQIRPRMRSGAYGEGRWRERVGAKVAFNVLSDMSKTKAGLLGIYGRQVGESKCKSRVTKLPLQQELGEFFGRET